MAASPPLSESPPVRPARPWVPHVVLGVALALTALAAGTTAASAIARDRNRFENAVQVTEDRISSRLDAYATVLQSAAGYFAATGSRGTQEDFRRFLAPLRLEQRYRGIQGVGLSLLIRDREAFEAEWRERLSPEFHLWPEQPRAEYHAVVWLEPLDRRNLEAIGFDMFTDPVRRDAMTRARDTGEVALSGSVTLVQEIDTVKQPGFLMYQPIYAGGATPPTVAERREELLGFAYAPFRAADLFHGIFGTERQLRVGFELFDGDGVDPERLLHAEHLELLGGTPEFEATRAFHFAGRDWTLRTFSLPRFEARSNQSLVPWLALVGIAISLVLFSLSRAQTRAAAIAEERAEAVRSAMHEISESNRRKDEFLAMLAHELRNPLAPVLAAAQLIQRKLARGLDVTREREVIERQVKHIVRLVDDLLDVSRITRGKIVLQRRPVSINAVVASAVEVVRPLADARDHSLTVTMPDESLWVDADPVRLEQVLNNLLTNAAKYTPPGGDLRVTVEAGAGEAVVRVKDTGIGIAKEAQATIFEPFVQEERALDRGVGGLGIGLTLVHRLTVLHGGRVEVFSEGVGKGAEFTLRFPFGPAPITGEPPPSADGSAREVAPLEILVVDDNVDAAEALADVLRFEGSKVEVAHSGREALAKLERFHPDVVFLDIGLPEMDGYQVARRIRAMPEHERVRLIALTGYGQSSDRQRSREAGFDLHLVKPVELETLRAALMPPA